MVTAAGSDNVAADAFQLGASYFIMKPFNREIVLDKIHRVCSGSVRLYNYAERKRVQPYVDKTEYIQQNLENDVTSSYMRSGSLRILKGISI